MYSLIMVRRHIMPDSTSVIKPAMMDKDDAELMTPELNNGGYFKWTPSVITVTAYAYAHVWDNASTLEKEVRLIVNIPMNYLPDNATEWKFLDNSYYQIPVSTKKELNRNTCYEVNVTVDAPGGSNPSKPVLLKDISYSVRDWDEERINVGGDTDRPAYLTLNEYEMEMHNMADDNTTLEFASSSEVTATIDRVYYIDKFGQEKELTQITNGSADEWGENIGSDYRPNWKNRCIIKITPDENITGKIQVHGDVPGNNAVRYIIFIVIHLKNELVRTIMIAEMILGAIQLRDMEMIIYLLQRWRKKLKPAAIGENLLYHTIIIIGGKLHLVPMKFGMQVMPECIMFRSRQVLGIIL